MRRTQVTVGTDGDDTIIEGRGRNEIDGGAGNDFIDGGRGADILNGGDGNDTLIGGEGRGRDTLDGGAGDDTMTGGGGTDFFVYTSGNDVITDFTQTGRRADQDLLVLDADGPITNFQDLLDSATIDGDDVVFDFGDAGTLTLENFDLDDLGVKDVLFV